VTLAIRWTRRSLRRLDEIGQYISTENAPAAARVIDRLVSIVDLLSDVPVMGRTGRIPGTRELVIPRLPYILVYRLTARTVDILTILHASQRWPKELG
jgi:addiction module RelE/StbE family toxin